MTNESGMHLKVVFVLPAFPWQPAGGYRVVYEYAGHLALRGHDVTVAHPRSIPCVPPPPTLYRRLRRLAARVRDTLLTPRLDWQPVDARVRLAFVPEISDRFIPDADAVIATAWNTAPAVHALGAAKGRKFYLIQDKETWSGSQEAVESTWRLPMRKLVISRWLLETLRGMGLGELFYLPNGLNHTLFQARIPVENRAKRIALLYSSAQRKGPADAVRALELIHVRMPDVQMAAYGVERRPRMLPESAEYYKRPSLDTLVNRIYNDSTIFLCSSLVEGWGLPGAEASACGCALVSTDNGGVREYAVDGESALLSPPGQPEALAENALRLLSDDALRIVVARKAQARMRDFTWERSTAILEELLRSV